MGVKGDFAGSLRARFSYAERPCRSPGSVGSQSAAPVTSTKFCKKWENEELPRFHASGGFSSGNSGRASWVLPTGKGVGPYPIRRVPVTSAATTSPPPHTSSSHDGPPPQRRMPDEGTNKEQVRPRETDGSTLSRRGSRRITALEEDTSSLPSERQLYSGSAGPPVDYPQGSSSFQGTGGGRNRNRFSPVFRSEVVERARDTAELNLDRVSDDQPNADGELPTVERGRQSSEAGPSPRVAFEGDNMKKRVKDRSWSGKPWDTPYDSGEERVMMNRAHSAAEPLPTVFPMSDSALRALIPISGSGMQVLQCLGGPLDWFRRFILSMAGAVLLYNVNPICTIVAAFYWAWAPIWSAALSNMALRSKYPYAGLWIGRVQRASLVTGPDGVRKWRLVVGDRAGVVVTVIADVPNALSKLSPGEPVQMVALSDTRSFSRFKVLREAFLPRRGIWLAEDAAVERLVFESLQVRLVPAVLNKLPLEDDEDWDGLFTLLCDETTETLRQYNYEEEVMGSNLSDSENPSLGIFDSPGADTTSGLQGFEGGDLSFQALFTDSQEAEIRDRYQDLT